MDQGQQPAQKTSQQQAQPPIQPVGTGKPELEPSVSPELNLEQLRKIESETLVKNEATAEIITKPEAAREVPIAKELQNLGVSQGADTLLARKETQLIQAGSDLATASIAARLPDDVKPVPMTYDQAVTNLKQYKVSDSIDWLAAMTARIWKKFNKFLR